MKKIRPVRPVIIDGVEIMTDLTAVEIADLPIINAELKEENQKLKKELSEIKEGK